VVPEPVRTYLLHDLAATPSILVSLLETEADWDARPFPDRFSLREALAHLADWESIWQERITRICSEDNPFLPSVDEGKLAAERDYSSRSPQASIAAFIEGRNKVLKALRALPDEAWRRRGHREFVGDIDLFQLVVMISGHDGYHLRQVCEYTRGPS
jgi:hypothetical protein